jgi:uncharacterized protein (TIGR03905 family)
MYSYVTKGVCSKKIAFDIIDNKISNVSFTGGCAANLEGLSRLIEGMSVKEVINKLSGIECESSRGKSTSCPDQLSVALKEAIR